MKLNSKQIRKILIFQKKIGVMLFVFGLIALWVMISTQEDCTIPILIIASSVYVTFSKNVLFETKGSIYYVKRRKDFEISKRKEF